MIAQSTKRTRNRTIDGYYYFVIRIIVFIIIVILLLSYYFYDILIFLKIYNFFLLTTNIRHFVNKLCKVYMCAIHVRFASFNNIFKLINRVYVIHKEWYTVPQFRAPV